MQRCIFYLLYLINNECVEYAAFYSHVSQERSLNGSHCCIFSHFYSQIIYNLICIFTPIKKNGVPSFSHHCWDKIESYIISFFPFPPILTSSPVQSLLLWPHLHHHPSPGSLLGQRGPGGCGRQAGVSGGSDPGRPQFSRRWEQQLYMTRKLLELNMKSKCSQLWDILFNPVYWNSPRKLFALFFTFIWVFNCISNDSYKNILEKTQSTWSLFFQRIRKKWYN